MNHPPNPKPDCTHNAVAYMLHEFIVGHITEVHDDDDSPSHYAAMLEESNPCCYPRTQRMFCEINTWLSGDGMDYAAEELKRFLESPHACCDYQTCRKDQP